MQSGSPWTTPAKRVGVLVLVALFHATLLYRLADGLARQAPGKDPKFVDIRIIPEPLPMARTVAPAPPPKPKRARPASKPPPKRAPRPRPAAVPSPALAIATPAPAPAPPPSQAATDAPAPMPAPAMPIRTAPVADPRSCAKPDYPAASRRFEESGAVVLNLLIDKQGRVMQSKIVSSSGYERLDQAALRVLRLCRFRPATVDGKPEQSWNKLTYVWRLTE